jgi:hypothetical protein
MNRVISNTVGKVLTGCFLMVLSGCGGGGGTGNNAGTPAAPVVPVTPASPTTATISYKIANPTATSIQGIQFSAYLPVGADVPLEGGTHTLQTSALVAGSALAGINVQLFGTYSAPIRKLKLVVMTTDRNSLQSGFTQGDVVTVTCNLISGNNLTESSFTTENSSHPIANFLAYQYANSQLVDITSSLTASLSVVVK